MKLFPLSERWICWSPRQASSWFFVILSFTGTGIGLLHIDWTLYYEICMSIWFIPFITVLYLWYGPSSTSVPTHQLVDTMVTASFFCLTVWTFPFLYLWHIFLCTSDLFTTWHLAGRNTMQNLNIWPFFFFQDNFLLIIVIVSTNGF